jgi:hypothetical protein
MYVNISLACLQVPEDGATPASLKAGNSFRSMNDKDLAWLWAASSALFPQTYINQPLGKYPESRNRTKTVTFASHQRMVDDQVAEAMHVADSVKDKSKRPAVFAYGRAFWYDSLIGNATSGLMQPEDLALTVARPAAHGAAGVVLWGACQIAARGRPRLTVCTRKLVPDHRVLSQGARATVRLDPQA